MWNNYLTSRKTTVARIVHFVANHLFFEFGPGAFMFGDWTDYGIMAAFGYRIDVTENLAIPIKLRTEIIFDKDTNLYPVGLSFGVSYSF